MASWLACRYANPKVSTQVCQSEGAGLKSRSGQIAYFHGVKTRLSTLRTRVVYRLDDPIRYVS